MPTFRRPKLAHFRANRVLRCRKRHPREKYFRFDSPAVDDAPQSLRRSRRSVREIAANAPLKKFRLENKSFLKRHCKHRRGARCAGGDGGRLDRQFRAAPIGADMKKISRKVLTRRKQLLTFRPTGRAITHRVIERKSNEGIQSHRIRCGARAIRDTSQPIRSATSGATTVRGGSDSRCAYEPAWLVRYNSRRGAIQWQ